MPTKKVLIGNGLSLIIAALGCVATWLVTIHYLATPDSALDWAVLICSGFTVAIILFFLTWGHFQETPRENMEK